MCPAVKMGKRKAPVAMQPSDDDEEYEEGSDGGEDLGSEEAGADGVVGFGGDEEADTKKNKGRRGKREKEQRKKLKAGTFDSMGLGPMLLKAIKRKGFRLPTPIQRRAMPLILQGGDVIGMARTGSGKTAAFVIPMIEKLKAHSIKAGARALLLAPTRELALQTHKTVRELARFSDLRTAVLVGGDALEAQFAELANNPDIIVATPGRLLHHLSEVEGMSLRSVEYCVLDEADRLFEMGFAEQIKEIMGKMGDARQTLLFSATLPRTLADFASAGLNAPQLVRLDTERRVSPDLHQLFITVRQEDKVPALLHLVREQLPNDQLTIVFAATRHHVEYLANLMARENIPCACVFGSMDQTARKIHVAKFRAKKVPVLITTDVAARGIDIPLIDNVINLDFPPKPELFVHRVGRAARMGRSGTAYSLLTRDELPYLLDLHLFLGRKVQPTPQVPTKEQLEAGYGGHDPDAPAIYGSFPTQLIAPQADRLKHVEAQAAELSGMQRTLSNAFTLYLKTRPPASTESVNRAKQLQKEGMHPALLAQLPALQRVDLESEAALAEFTAALRSFRPAATVLEAEIAAVKSPHASVPLLDSNSIKSKSNDVMQKKRAAHAVTIEQERQKRMRLAQQQQAAAAAAVESSGEGDDDDDDAAGPGDAKLSQARKAAAEAMEIGDGVLNEGKYRDKGLYIGHTRDQTAGGDDGFQMDQATAELEQAVLDLTAEDQEGLAAQKRRFHWDKRKKKYVQLQGKDATAGQAAKRIKTESGATVIDGKDKGKKGLYKKWVQTQHKRVAASGSMETAGASSAAADALSRRFDPSMRHQSWQGPKQDRQQLKGEQLKSKDQVRKERAKKEKRKAWLQQKQSGKGPQRPAGSDWKPKAHAMKKTGGGRGEAQGASTRGGAGRAGDTAGAPSRHAGFHYNIL